MTDVSSRALKKLAVRTVVVAAALTGLAWCHTCRQADVYTATAMLVLDAKPYEMQERATRGNGATTLEAPEPLGLVRTTLPPPPAMPDIAALLLCDEVMEQLRPALRQLQQQNGMGDAMPSRVAVRSALDVRPRILLQTPAEIFYQHTLELRVATKHPQVSAGLANAWAELGAGFVDRLRHEGLRSAADSFAGALSRTQAELVDLHAKRAAAESDPLNREIETLEAYEYALRIKSREAELAACDTAPVLRIASRAQAPERPSGPNRRVVLLAALFMGVILGPASLFFARAARVYAPLLFPEEG